MCHTVSMNESTEEWTPTVVGSRIAKAQSKQKIFRSVSLSPLASFQLCIIELLLTWNCVLVTQFTGYQPYSLLYGWLLALLLLVGVL